MITKRCNRTEHVGERELPATREFFYASPRKGELHNWCIECCKANARENTLAHKRACRVRQETWA